MQVVSPPVDDSAASWRHGVVAFSDTTSVFERQVLFDDNTAQFRNSPYNENVTFQDIESSIEWKILSRLWLR